MKIRFAVGLIGMSKKAWVAYGSSKDVGASPLFSPPHQDIETAAPESLGRLYRSPLLYGLKQSRWTLQALQEQVDWLQHTRTGKPMSLPGICKLLDRLAVTYKRGRAHLHSPDLLYNKKMAYIRSLHELNHTDPERYVLLYEDELTYYRRAGVNRGWAGTGQRMAIKVKEASPI